ncbi:MAG TPA: hypothetical protein VHB21_07550 [Minicystis sp.]|nr:hypothetical protein [Minicystis sp.]
MGQGSGNGQGGNTTDRADVYESADDASEVAEFPTDTSSTGKHYQVAVPDYLPGQSPKFNSYFRHGVPHSSASTYEQDAWTQNSQSVELGDDLLVVVTPPDGFQSDDGGVRDHTDGNRIVTTRHDHIEVIQGQYRQIVLSNQKWEEEDQDWKTPTEGGEEEPSVAEHIYTSWYYEVISSTNQPGPNSFAEPRMKVEDAKKAGYDFYEYINAENVVEVMAGETSLVEKLYAGRALEVFSTQHKDHADWETKKWGGVDPTNLKEGDLVDFLFAENLTEVIRADDTLVDKIYGDKLVEVISTRKINDWSQEIDPKSLASGDLYEYMNAKNLYEYLRAEETFFEEIKGINIVERLLAFGSVDELTAAIGGINELTIAGGEIVDVMLGGVFFLDVIAAVGAFVEVIAGGLLNVEIVASALCNIEWSLAPFSHEFKNFHKEWSLEKEEFHTMKTAINANFLQVAAEYNRLADDVNTIDANSFQIAGVYQVV